MTMYMCACTQHSKQAKPHKDGGHARPVEKHDPKISQKKLQKSQMTILSQNPQGCQN